MSNVVFVAPFPLEATLRFVRAVGSLPGVRLLLVYQEPPPRQDRLSVADHEQVADALSTPHLLAAVEALARRNGRIDRVVGVLESAQVQLAEVRERLGIPGQSVASARRFRDKSLMKEALRAHGLPCARHRLLRSRADVDGFIREVGLPIVIKPPSGVGCRSTYRIDSEADLDEAMAELSPSDSRVLLAEEFLSGDEHTFETITLAGRPVFHSISRYRPGPLEAMRNPWIQYVVQLPRDIRVPEYDDVRDVGVKALAALGMQSGMTHMEWFRRPDGSVAIGEIAMRPPGVQLVPMMSYAYATNMYRAWARAVVEDTWEGPWERRFSVGCAFLRGVGQGKVVRVDGVDEAQRQMGSLVVEARLPQVGQSKADGYEGEGYAIIRHEDDVVVQRALSTLIQTVRVRYG